MNKRHGIIEDTEQKMNKERSQTYIEMNIPEQPEWWKW